MDSSDAKEEKVVYTSAPLTSGSNSSATQARESDELINASGHKQELERNFSLLSICGVAITTGNTWTAIGGSVVSNSSESCHNNGGECISV